MLKHVVIISIVTVLAVGCNESDPSGGKQAVTDAGTTSPDHGSTGTDTNTPDGNGAAGETNAHVDGTQGPIESCPALDESLTNTPLYDHRVQWASSTDGKNFTKDNQVLLEHASVPDAVVRPDGKVWVYFVNGNPGQHAVFVAEQQADGTLKTFDCIRIDGEINGNAVDPDIVLLDDGR